LCQRLLAWGWGARNERRAHLAQCQLVREGPSCGARRRQHIPKVAKIQQSELCASRRPPVAAP
jgi:hypothetical protein